MKLATEFEKRIASGQLAKTARRMTDIELMLATMECLNILMSTTTEQVENIAYKVSKILSAEAKRRKIKIRKPIRKPRRKK